MEENKTVEMVEKVTFKDKVKKFYVKHKTKVIYGLGVASTAAVGLLVCKLNSKDEEDVYVYEALEEPIEIEVHEYVEPIETVTESEEEA